MQLLYLTRKFPPGIGGAERVNGELARHLAEIADVRLVAHDTRSPARVAQLGVRAWRGRATHVFVGDASLAPLGAAVAWRHRAKLAVWAHGLDVAFPSRLYQRALVAGLRRADCVVAVSEATRRLVVARGVTHCRVLPHGREIVDGGPTRETARAALGIAEPTVLFLGRDVPRKGLAGLRRDIMPRVPGARLVVAGPGNLAVDERTRDLLLRAADCLAMPNVRRPGDPEGFGLVALEAAARGTPTVAYAVDGIPEAVGGAGRLVAPGDAAAFARGVRECLSDRAAWETRCRAHVARWPDWAAVARAFREAIA